MKPSRIALALLLSLAMASGAFAQSAWVEIEDDVMVPEFSQTADAIDDWDVMGTDGKKIGEVEEVIGAQAGAATALTVDFDDDAGFGDRDDVIAPLDQFTFADNRLTLNADAAAIGSMDVYND